MAILQVSADHDYRPDVLSNVTRIEFLDTVKATFSSSQFGGGVISHQVVVEGVSSPEAAQRPVIEVFFDGPAGSSFSAAMWDFSFFEPENLFYDDDQEFVVVRMIGTNATETIVGANHYLARTDFIASGGADVMIGGEGPDRFVYDTTGIATPGTVLDGRGDDRFFQGDTLLVQATNDFAGVHFEGIEFIHIEGADTVATFHGGDIPQGKSGAVFISGDPAQGTVQTLVLQAATLIGVSLKDSFFFAWGPEDSIILRGNVGQNELTGSPRDDLIEGFGRRDIMEGKRGDDTIVGGDGRDWLDGGLGDDLLTGGPAKDSFYFSVKPGNGQGVDHTADFTNEDKILLARDRFKGLDKGKLDSDAFLSGKKATKAEDGEDRIVYNETTGALYLDRDGIGGAKAVKFAILDGSPKHVGAGDFVVLA